MPGKATGRRSSRRSRTELLLTEPPTTRRPTPTSIGRRGEANECVGRYEQYLRRRGLLTDELAEQVREEALLVMREGIAAAEAEPPADPSEVFDHAYVDPPPGLRNG